MAELTCAFGYPHIGTPPCGGYHCPGCAKQGLKMTREFLQGVEDGRWDEQGYTPSDRRKQERDRKNSHSEIEGTRS